MEQKLRDLREQFDLGQRQMALLEQQRTELRDTMLRISGAIQVLEELVEQNGHHIGVDVALESKT
jgi:prefoldin subunit 5